MSMLTKIKESPVFKAVAVSALSSAVAAAGMFSTFATDPETSTVTSADFTSALTTAFGNMQSDIFSYILIVLPIALGVVGAFFGIRKAIGFFKSTAGK